MLKLAVDVERSPRGFAEEPKRDAEDGDDRLLTKDDEFQWLFRVVWKTNLDDYLIRNPLKLKTE